MKAALKIVPRTAAANGAPDCCPSCNAQAAGKFCSRCGESTVVHSPTAGEFLHEFIGHFVALEGKLWTTLRLLMFRPGQLTADYLRGRRVPTINPLRLYLSLSLVMFGLIKLCGVELPQVAFNDSSVTTSYTHSFPDQAEPGKSGSATLSILFETKGEDLYAVRNAITRLGSVDETWADNVERFANAPPAEKAARLNRGFLANLPPMLIGALPLFALYLKLIYWRSGRRYGEHLVFALHATAFAFLLASVMIIVPGNAGWLFLCLYEGKLALVSPWDYVQLLPLIWTVAYLPSALRRVYGGSRRAAWGKSSVLAATHLLVIFGLIIGAQVMAILKHG